MNVLITQKVITMNCYSCQVLFGMVEALYDRRRDDGRQFWCPNGHPQVFGENIVGRLEKEKAALAKQVEKERSDKAWYIGRLNAERDSHQHTEHRLRGTKAVVTRMKRRITAGACVCCSRKFKDLERHMKTQHPNFDPEKAVVLSEKELPNL